MRPAQRVDDARVGVPREVDVPLEVAADLDLVEVDVGELHQRLRRELRLAHRVVLELEIGRDLHQFGPVGAGR